jgi:enoyl-CoA hydratase/carnithine racemase
VFGPVSVAEATELLEAVRSGLGDLGRGAPLGEPVVLVDLDGAATEVDLGPPVGWPCVLVALSSASVAPPPPRGPDVLLSGAADPPAPWVGMGTAGAAAALETAIRLHPQAATTLAQVLRLGPSLAAAEALLVESLAYSTLQAGPEHRDWLRRRVHHDPDGRPEPTVLLDRIADTLWVTLNRPDRRNAYSARMRDELVAALEVPAADPTIASVHLAGVGPNFCSGGDLAEFGDLSDPATAHGIRMQHSAGRRISELAPRLTVHLHGACVGAGIELAAFAGKVEATEDATVALPEVSMGLIPGAGGTASLPRRIGPARTAWLALTGSPLDARTAHRWGLVDRLVPSEPREARA